MNGLKGNAMNHPIVNSTRLTLILENGESGRPGHGRPISWEVFLAALELFCSEQGWDLEYDSVDDESCAIFFQASGPPRAGAVEQSH